MSHNILLIISYDGGAYKGWQKNRDLPTIELYLEKVLAQILQQPIFLQATSRTDAGVHARHQHVNFLSCKSLQEIAESPMRFLISLNQLLPKDIRVIDVREMPFSFHPTLDCVAKEYRYYICYGKVQLPHYRHYSFHYHYPELDLIEMEKAAKILEGTHDFSLFYNQKKGSMPKHFERHIEFIKIKKLKNERLVIAVKGNNFFFRMVRNIVGFLLYIGSKKLRNEEINGTNSTTEHLVNALLLAKDRTKAGLTVPPHGLFLHKVYLLDDARRWS